MALLVLALCPALAAAAEPGFRPGVYVGGTGHPPRFVFTRLEVKSADGDALSATMTQPVDRAGEFAVDILRADASRLEFASGGETFDLRRTETGYAGSARDAGPPPSGSRPTRGSMTSAAARRSRSHSATRSPGSSIWSALRS